MLRFDRKWQNYIKQLSFNKKFKKMWSYNQNWENKELLQECDSVFYSSLYIQCQVFAWCLINIPLKNELGTSLVVQWLTLCSSTAGGASSVPGWWTHILHDLWHGHKVNLTNKNLKIVKNEHNKCEKLLSLKEMQMKLCMAYYFPLAKLANSLIKIVCFFFFKFFEEGYSWHIINSLFKNV